ADAPPDPVVRAPALALRIGNRHFRDARARRTRQRWYEPVEFPVELDLLQNLAAVGLERGAEIVQLDSGKFGHQPVRDAAWHLAHQPVVVRERLQPLTRS